MSKKRIWYAPNSFQAYGEDEIKAVEECLRAGGHLAGFGEKTKEFEARVAKIFGKKYGVFVNSGSSANMLALACLNLPKGSEVITAACTFATTVSPIIQLGLKPVFCDVIKNRYVASVGTIISLITEKTRVIMLPNLIGSKPNWKLLRQSLVDLNRNDIILIEDSCDTISETLESDISTTSFYASHIITSCGSGGMIMFNDEKLRNEALKYRDWGRIGDNSEDMGERFDHNVDGIPYDYKFLYGVLGYNFKSSEVNAAFGLVQLDKFERNKQIRRVNIERYLENLKDVSEILLPDDSQKPNWLAIPLQTERRMELLIFLEKNNIQTRVCFAGNITRHGPYRKYLQEFHNSDVIMKNAFLLGSHHGLNISDVDYVTDTIKRFFGGL